VNRIAKEDRTRKTMKRRRLGQIMFVIAAGISFLFSVFLWFSDRREEGLFVGVWVPSILSFGSLLLAGKQGEQG
jgi:hypothetical protein